MVGTTGCHANAAQLRGPEIGVQLPQTGYGVFIGCEHRRFSRVGRRRRLGRRDCRSGMLCLGLVILLGCGPDRIKVYPVNGKVLYKGKPAAGARIIFHPQGGSDKMMQERPVGFAGDDGVFQLTTFDSGDGAPAGEYIVTVKWTGGARQPSYGAADENAPPEDPRDRVRRKDRLKGKYWDPRKSELRAAIDEGPNDLSPFDLN